MTFLPRIRFGRHRWALAWFIARRYLFSRDRQALEWFVTGISISGVAVGVGTLIAVIGVMDGLRRDVINDLISFVPHLSIMNPAWNEADPDPTLVAMLRRQRGVRVAEPSLVEHGLLTIRDGKQTLVNNGTQFFATDRLERDNYYNVDLPPGVDAIELKPGQILVSAALTTATLIGREALITSGATVKTALYPIPKCLKLRVQGVFTTGDDWLAQHQAFATWADVRNLSLRPKGFNGYEVKLTDPLAAEKIKARLAPLLPKDTRITTWLEEHKLMFSQMKVLKSGMILVMFMTMLVAALNIIGTLALIVIQKTREIGILKAMGASRRLVGLIFLLEGSLVGLVGSVIGVILGSVFCWVIVYFKVPIPGEWRVLRHIPAEFDPWTALMIAVTAVVVCTLAAAAPARRAGRMHPVLALRHE